MNSRGSILVTVLWTISILAILAVWVGIAASMEIRAAKYAMDDIHASYLANAGIAKAVSIIVKMDNPAPREEGLLGGGRFAYNISDEEGRFNIRLDKTGLSGVQRYRRILKGLSDKLNDDMISAMIDWQDADSVVSPGGAEDIYYANLERPYRCKNGPFNYTEELLMVKGMTPGVFNELKDYITVYGDGKININTAPERVLDAVINEEGGYDSLVKKIMDYRRGPDMSEGTPDDGRFLNLKGDIDAKITPSAAEALRLASLSECLSCKSGNFRIVASGFHGRAVRTITCVTIKPDRDFVLSGIRYYHEE